MCILTTEECHDERVNNGLLLGRDEKHLPSVSKRESVREQAREREGASELIIIMIMQAAIALGSIGTEAAEV